MVVDEEDLQQWDKVVCCIAVTTDVYQTTIDGRVPKDVRLIVSAKPQHYSRAASGFSLCADSVATFEKPFTNLIGNVMSHSNVMFYEADAITSDHMVNGRMSVYRESSINNLVGIYTTGPCQQIADCCTVCTQPTSPLDLRQRFYRQDWKPMAHQVPS